jgi:tetratricopeptide (TPR) repeat protein
VRSGRDDPSGAALLAAALGELPLALDQAGAYCRQSGIAFGDYVALLPERLRLLHKRSREKPTVTETLKLAMQRATEECPDAETLLGILSCFSADPIPLGCLHTVMPVLRREQALATLANYSLIRIELDQATGAAVSVHKLVQLVVREGKEGYRWNTPVSMGAAREHPLLDVDRRSLPEFDRYVGEALEFLDREGYENHPGAHLFAATAIVARHFVHNQPSVANESALRDALFPHALSVMRHAPCEFLVVSERLIGELSQFVLKNFESGGWEQFLVEVIELHQRMKGDFHPDVGHDLMMLGDAYRLHGKASEAQKTYLRALKIYRRTDEGRGVAQAAALSSLGIVYHDSGQLESAVEVLETAASIYSEILGATHDYTKTVRDRLNRVLAEKWKFG